ncbi:hypothetical protein BBJ28_00010362 [Nothophytophthora sp. Chile5]|nr:hypothetical protein BBJ28_00010362 [Nothophytophthora sp. Chile5]
MSWSSTFMMLERFFKEQEHLDREDDVIADLLPSAASMRMLKALQESLHKMTHADRLAMRGLKCGAAIAASEEETSSFADRVLKRAHVAEKASEYQLIPAVMLTSKAVEQLLSVARATVGLERSSLLPTTLESIMFLKTNRMYWDDQVMQECFEQ